MHFLFIFIDGIGLGPNDISSNPFAKALLPNLNSLIGNKKLVIETLEENGYRITSKLATFLGLDANLGINGHPQSATGQATILTGINVPKKLGMHFGPWPNEEIRTLLRENSIFTVLKSRGFKSILLNEDDLVKEQNPYHKPSFPHNQLNMPLNKDLHMPQSKYDYETILPK